MVIVQHPDSAKYTGMPQSAIHTGVVDIIIPPTEMPTRLHHYIRYSFKKHIKEVSHVPKDVEPNAYQKIYALLKIHTGHDFSFYKKNTINRRIERRMIIHHLDDLKQYSSFLEKDHGEIRLLFKELLIGVTGFFRDSPAFEILKEKVFPQMFQTKGNPPDVRIWVPGSSSGEEAYSLAILLKEYMEISKKSFKVQIFTTDIDDEAVERGRSGVFLSNIAAEVSEERLKKYFIKEDNFYKIRKDIRNMLIFAVQNVTKDPPFSQLDFISCRNLFIYLSIEMQQKLLHLFHYVLKPGGILFLGSSESIGNLDFFTPIDKKWKIYKRRESPNFHHFITDFPISMTRKGVETPQAENQRNTGTELSKQIEKILLEKYTPVCVVVNEKGEIIHIHGYTGKYFELPSGPPNLNLVSVAREGLKYEISSAFRKAREQKKPVFFKNVRIKINGGLQWINFSIHPITESKTLDGLFMILFEDIDEPEKSASGNGEKIVHVSEAQHHIEELENELRYIRENLQSTIEELEVSNEELKSTNEELQSTNEELQSTNEELETSKEELQSLNEELNMVNAELQNKIDELSEASNYLNNLLNSTDIATIFLDNDLKIKRFTPQITKIINLIHSDIGRPLQHVVTNLKYQNILQDARKVLDSLVRMEKEVQTEDGRWYLMRILPYRTSTNIIEGVVITFIDINDLKETQIQLQAITDDLSAAQEYAHNILQTIKGPIIVLNNELKVISANQAFYKTFKVESVDTEQQFFYELGNEQWNITELRQLLTKVIEEKSHFQDYLIEYDFPHIGKKRMLVTARELKLKSQKTSYILIAIDDITEN